MERLLVTGVDFPVGSNLALRLAEHCDVLGLYSRYAVECATVRTACYDPSRPLLLKQLVQAWHPQWIIHCGPLSASSWDAPHEQTGQREPQAVVQWVDLAADLGARLTVVSSDVVFCGPRMFHEENSTCGNESQRAQQVRAMERSLESSSALVVRTHAYGWSPVAEHAGFAQQTFERLSIGRSPAADGRRYATPILATDLADLLMRAYEMRLQGLYHLAGAERTNPFRFVTELTTSLGFHAPRWETTDTQSAEPTGRDGSVEARLNEEVPAAETSLNSKRARRMLETGTPLLREGLNRFAGQAHNGWRERWQVLGHAAMGSELAA